MYKKMPVTLTLGLMVPKTVGLRLTWYSIRLQSLKSMTKKLFELSLHLQRVDGQMDARLNRWTDSWTDRRCDDYTV